MTITKRFHLAHLLSIAQSRLIPAPNTDPNRPIVTVYEILNFMVGESNDTVQLLYIAYEVKPLLLEQFPWLEEAASIAESKITEDNWQEILSQLVTTYGEWFDVYPMHPDDHTHLDTEDIVKAINPDIEIIPFDSDE